jgi:hypothetical protein
MAIITFTDTIGVHPSFKPIPASELIPNWYKEIDSYRSGKKMPSPDSMTTATIKRCMPVFDAITSGYLILSLTDVWVTSKESENEKIYPYYQWSMGNPIEFHPIEQAPTHPNANGAPFPKWMNPWSIKTPKGYSTLFTNPIHHKLPFTILTGVVDTDEYTPPVNFPFVLNDINFEGLIPAGTPIAQVIPFQRESWKMEIGKDKDREESNKNIALLKTKFFDSYKNLFRQKKEYL